MTADVIDLDDHRLTSPMFQSLRKSDRRCGACGDAWRDHSYRKAVDCCTTLMRPCDPPPPIAPLAAEIYRIALIVGANAGIGQVWSERMARELVKAIGAVL